MVVNNAKDLALHGVIGSNVDGLVKAPDHQRDGYGGVETNCRFLHRGILMEPFQCTTAEAYSACNTTSNSSRLTVVKITS